MFLPSASLPAASFVPSGEKAKAATAFVALMVRTREPFVLHNLIAASLVPPPVASSAPFGDIARQLAQSLCVTQLESNAPSDKRCTARVLSVARLASSAPLGDAATASTSPSWSPIVCKAAPPAADQILTLKSAPPETTLWLSAENATAYT